MFVSFVKNTDIRLYIGGVNRYRIIHAGFKTVVRYSYPV
jgi:hypothetical protein